MSRFSCTATFTVGFDPVALCEVGTSGIILTIAGDASSGTFGNIVTNTIDNPFTNPSAFPLEVGDTICVNGSGEVIAFTPCEEEAQFFVDDLTNPITSKFPTCNLTPALAQIIINSHITNPNVTITITDIGGGLATITVSIKDGSTHTIAIIGVFVEGDPVPVFTFDAPFVCKKIGRRTMGALVRCPDEIIFKAPTSLPQVKYCNHQYNFYGSDEQGFLHYIKSNSDISQRNTKGWWAYYVK